MNAAKHHNRSSKVVLALLFLTSGCSHVATIEADILALENQRYQAMVERNMEFLDSILDENLIFTHASGKVDNKKSFVNTLESGSLVYKSIGIEDLELRRYESSGVATGRSNLQLIVRGEDRALSLRFTSVWVKKNSGWKIVAYQSTLLP